MSSSPGTREVAHRLFAAEFDDADLSYSESDEERAPNYVITPTGARVNRLFFVGVLTETERVNEEMLRARVVDPTGAFVTYAGQYQPDELAFLERAESPAFLAVTGKARTFQPEDSDRVYTSARPESISEVDGETRDRWVVQAAERTVDRVRVAAAAIASDHRGDALEAALGEAGVDEALAQGVALALDHYGTTPAYLEAQRDLAVQAAETVAGDRDEVDRQTLAPDEGDGDAAALADADLVEALAAAEPEVVKPAEPGAAEAQSVETGSAEVETQEAETTAAGPAGSTSDGIGGDEAETEPVTDADSEPTADAETEAETEQEPEPVEATAGTEAAGGAGVDQGGETDEVDATGEGEDEDGDDLGDFEPSEFDVDEVDEEDLDEALTDEEREEVEENFDTDFATGNELDDESAGEDTAGDDSPAAAAAGNDPVDNDAEEAARPEAADEDAPETAEGEPLSPGEPDSEVAPAAEEDPEAQYDDEPEPSDNLDTGVASEAETKTGDEGEVDIEEAVMETMKALDDGDGADHEELVQTVADEYGVAVGDAEDAIEDALMSGQCYEPADGKLKPI